MPSSSLFKKIGLLFLTVFSLTLLLKLSLTPGSTLLFGVVFGFFLLLLLIRFSSIISSYPSHLKQMKNSDFWLRHGFREVLFLILSTGILCLILYSRLYFLGGVGMIISFLLFVLILFFHFTFSSSFKE
ncbi:MAG: hypothetical protein ACD_28C00150G0007 [uncultured bacterium]|nr:MAG: hypothetical protein ACD_28C00150G0007 [uncultured bacterium]KKT75226.1 MAG: hypothetical protein UW70_C0037G0040 [Candidatus Peregrinibacteria bacterium GW2011_GWA2_44_7]